MLCPERPREALEPAAVPSRAAVGFGVAELALGAVVRARFPGFVAEFGSEFVFALCLIPLVGLAFSRLVTHS